MIGQRIKTLREQSSISNAELARKTGISQSHLVKLQAKNAQSVSLQTAALLCGALECSLDCLVFGKQDRYERRNKAQKAEIRILRAALTEATEAKLRNMK